MDNRGHYMDQVTPSNSGKCQHFQGAGAYFVAAPLQAAACCTVREDSVLLGQSRTRLAM